MTAEMAPSALAQVSWVHVLAAAVCACVLGIDLSEIAVGSALSAVFAAAPYRLEPQALATLLSSVYFGAFLGAPCLGYLADRCGLKRILALALGWLGLVSWAIAIDAHLSHLPGLRFLAGLSLGALPPLVISYLTGIAPPQHRARLILWVSALSFLAGPATIFGVRGLLKSHPLGIEGWRWPFLAAGTLALILSLLFRVLPGVPGQRGSESGIKAEASQQLYVRAHGKRFAFLGSLYFLYPWAAVGFSITLGPALIQRGYDLTNTLFYVAMSLFGPTVSTFFAGTIADRVDRRLALAGSCGIMLVASLLFCAADSRPVLLGAVILFGVASGFYLPLMTAYGAEIFPTRVRSSATSGAWALNRVAAFLAPLVLLPLLHTRGDLFVTLAICVALAASAGLLLSLGAAPQWGAT